MFACNLCGEGFATSDNVRNHIVNKHKGVLNNIDCKEDKEERKQTEISCDNSFCLEVTKSVCRYLED